MVFMIIISGTAKDCPIDCEHYDNEGDPYREFCYASGTFVIENDVLTKCPLGKW